MVRSRVCVDASLVVALLVPERITEASTNLWFVWMQDDAEIVAPTLLRYEVTSAIYRKSLQERIAKEDTRNTLGQFLEMDIVYRDPASLPIRAFEIAEQFDRPNTFDAHYLALAEHLDCPFWTLDERLYNATHTTFDLINWVGAVNNSFV
jgi:predicted nucleic acid-binding protein